MIVLKKIERESYQDATIITNKNMIIDLTWILKLINILYFDLYQLSLIDKNHLQTTSKGSWMRKPVIVHNTSRP